MVKELELIKEEAIKIQNSLSTEEKKLFEFDKCVLCDGPIDANVMVVARDLGKDEIKEGVPLIGAAGSLYRLVEDSLNAEAFLCNIVPFKPMYNKAFPKNIREQFYPIVDKLIKVVKPKAILAMGNESLCLFLGLESGILNFALDRQPLYGGRYHDIAIFPIAHPSYLIHNGVNSFTLKRNKEKRNMFKELFYFNIYRAFKFAGDI